MHEMVVLVITMAQQRNKRQPRDEEEDTTDDMALIELYLYSDNAEVMDRKQTAPRGGGGEAEEEEERKGKDANGYVLLISQRSPLVKLPLGR